MTDLLPQNVSGTWETVQYHPIIATVYPMFKTLNWDGCFFGLNIQDLSDIDWPLSNFDKFVISFHTEYLKHDKLFELFDQNPNKKFLLLCDQLPKSFWPPNVTMLQWLTYPHQLDTIVKHYGVADITQVVPTKKISSLSHRNDLHKEAITAFLVEEFELADVLVSCHNKSLAPLYYQSQNFFIPEPIKKYISGKQLPPRLIDAAEFCGSSPIGNSDWRHCAYLETAINLTNESVFNSRALVNGIPTSLPTPYLTEKTWKPLLAGQAFIPIGQTNTLTELTRLGFQFEYEFDISFDSELHDFDRLAKIFNLLQTLKNYTPNELRNMTVNSCKHNLDHIQSGKLHAVCNSINECAIDRIASW